MHKLLRLILVTASFFLTYAETEIAHDSIVDTIKVAQIAQEQQLLKAVSENDITKVQELVNQKVNLEVRDSEGRTPLLLAAYCGHIDMTKFLIASGADVSALDKAGCNFMILFILYFETPDGQLIGYQNADTFEQSWLELLDIIIEKQHDDIINDFLTMQNPQAGQTFFPAIKYGCKHVCNYLLKHKHNVNAQEEDSGITALVYALEHDQHEIAKMLIDAGADVNLGNPLNCAIRDNNLEIAELLLSRGASVHLPKEPLNDPFMFAIYSNNAAMVQLLLKHGANLSLENAIKLTPLMFAAMQGEIAMVELLLNLGAAVNQQNQLGETAAIITQESFESYYSRLAKNEKVDHVPAGTYPRILKLLIERGADLHIKDCKGRTVTNMIEALRNRKQN